MASYALLSQVLPNALTAASMYALMALSFNCTRITRTGLAVPEMTYVYPISAGLEWSASNIADTAGHAAEVMYHQ